MRLAGLVLVLAMAAGAQMPVASPDLLEPIQPFRRDRGDTAYKVSVAALVTATTLDHVSSIGKQERTPYLRGDDGGYASNRGAAIKAGTVAAALLAQHYAMKRDKSGKAKWIATGVNLALAGWFGGIAAINFTK